MFYLLPIFSFFSFSITLTSIIILSFLIQLKFISFSKPIIAIFKLICIKLKSVLFFHLFKKFSILKILASLIDFVGFIIHIKSISNLVVYFTITCFCCALVHHLYLILLLIPYNF